MPVQLVEVEVLAELLESMPPIANDNSEDIRNEQAGCDLRARIDNAAG